MWPISCLEHYVIGFHGLAAKEGADFDKILQQVPNSVSITDKQDAIDALLNALTQTTAPGMLHSSGQLHSHAFLSADYSLASLSCPEILATKRGLEVLLSAAVELIVCFCDCKAKDNLGLPIVVKVMTSNFLLDMSSTDLTSLPTSKWV